MINPHLIHYPIEILTILEIARNLLQAIHDVPQVDYQYEDARKNAILSSINDLNYLLEREFN